MTDKAVRVRNALVDALMLIERTALHRQAIAALCLLVRLQHIAAEHATVQQLALSALICDRLTP